MKEGTESVYLQFLCGVQYYVAPGMHGPFQKAPDRLRGYIIIRGFGSGQFRYGLIAQTVARLALSGLRYTAG